ncbi:type 1 glutamine amidotransferase [Candidatus Gracilibacteria bacterium]|nr:type 1 glutamine amidotransferase [Candidatus Gracilibacteria bacterium]MCF7898992.1 type 1 glutamine amidotransferase [Candidatus Paceibacterota bacterium]
MKKKAVVITDQCFEDEEVIYPIIRLKEEGFDVDVATRNKTLTIGRKNYPLETLIKFYAGLVDSTKLDDSLYDLVVIPGGFEAPDRVRQIPEVLAFLNKFYSSGKIIAAICHGPWVLISAKIVRGKKITGIIGIKDDIENAGAEYVDSPVVIDGNIITSRHPRDLGEFMKAIISKF